MKRSILCIFILIGLLTAIDTHAQRYRRHYHPRYSYAPRIRVIPRVVIPPPAIRFYWNPGTRVIITPPPIIIGSGRGWRHYHRRGYSCNGRCHRWYDDDDYRRYDRRYDERRDEYYDRERRNDRRYNYNDDREEYRFERNKYESQEAKRIDSDEDWYEETE